MFCTTYFNHDSQMIFFSKVASNVKELSGKEDTNYNANRHQWHFVPSNIPEVGLIIMLLSKEHLERTVVGALKEISH